MINVRLELIHRELKDARAERPPPQRTYSALCKKAGDLGLALHRSEHRSEDVAEAIEIAVLMCGDINARLAMCEELRAARPIEAT